MSRTPAQDLQAIWETMDQVRRSSGGSWDHVAIGTDFDGFTDPPTTAKGGTAPPYPGVLRVERVARKDVEAVLRGNARRVLRNSWR